MTYEVLVNMQYLKQKYHKKISLEWSKINMAIYRSRLYKSLGTSICSVFYCFHTIFLDG